MSLTYTKLHNNFQNTRKTLHSENCLKRKKKNSVYWVTVSAHNYDHSAMEMDPGGSEIQGHDTLKCNLKFNLGSMRTSLFHFVLPKKNPQALSFRDQRWATLQTHSIYKCLVWVLPAFVPFLLLPNSFSCSLIWWCPFHNSLIIPIHRSNVWIISLSAFCLLPSFYVLLLGSKGNHKKDLWLPREKFRARWAGSCLQIQLLPSHERKQHVQF